MTADRSTDMRIDPEYIDDLVDGLRQVADLEKLSSTFVFRGEIHTAKWMVVVASNHIARLAAPNNNQGGREAIKAFLRERDEALGPYEEDDTERYISADAILALLQPATISDAFNGLAPMPTPTAPAPLDQGVIERVEAAVDERYAKALKASSRRTFSAKEYEADLADTMEIATLSLLLADLRALLSDREALSVEVGRLWNMLHNTADAFDALAGAHDFANSAYRDQARSDILAAKAALQQGKG